MGQSFLTWEYVIGFRPRCSQEASWYSVVLWAELQGLELRDPTLFVVPGMSASYLLANGKYPET